MAWFSADNIAFGQGGALLQAVDRDTMQFAMKCSSIKVDGSWRDVYKDPITDSGKRSKRGRVDLIKEKGQFYTAKEDWMPSYLQVVYQNGATPNLSTFAQVRSRAVEGLTVNKVALTHSSSVSSAGA